MTNVVILGSGMAAWGAWQRFHAEGVAPQVFDKNSFPGGHTASFHSGNGFVFDDGPHISFTEIEQVRDVFADAVDHDFEVLQADVDNWYEGTWIKHPAIAYLNPLPDQLKKQILEDFTAACDTPIPDSFNNYHEWLLSQYGPTFANNFPGRYGTKYHTCGPEQMNTSWLGPRLYRPALDEVLKGAETEVTEKKHYIDKFRYPKKNGFEAYLHKFFDQATMHLGHKAVKIDASARVVEFENGNQAPYDQLVSSVPLADVVAMIPEAPDHVREAAALLSCSQCVVVNFGVDCEDLSPSHWRYIYDEDINSVRLSFPHMFSPTTCPPGHGAVQVEVYFSEKYKPLNQKPEDLIPIVQAELTMMGVLKEDENIVFSEARFIPYANVIFDLDSDECAKVVQDYLRSIDVNYCGRYGDWAYIWTDQSWLSGERAAQRVLDGMTS